MKTHIMLIDDDKDELVFLLNALKEVPCDDGFKCTYAGSASQAIKTLTYLVPDFIFIDFRMPEINGLQFLSAIRRWPIAQKSKIYLYSVFDDEAVKKAALNLGASGSITKKYTIRALSDELVGILTSPAYVFSNRD